MSDDLFLSIIIPAHNEEHRLPSTLTKINSFLESQPYHSEVLVVENGSRDQTLNVAQSFSQQWNQLRVLHEDGQGKGLAVRRGMLAAKGQYRYMADADLSTPIEEVKRFLPPQLLDFDIAIGSREAPGAVRYAEPMYRHWGGRFINWIIRSLALPGLMDTQCGFKCFRDMVAKDLFEQQRLSGFAFDVEILYIARMRNYRIVEVGVPWYFNPESKVSIFRDSIRMVLDIWMMRKKHSML